MEEIRSMRKEGEEIEKGKMREEKIVKRVEERKGKKIGKERGERGRES